MGYHLLFYSHDGDRDGCCKFTLKTDNHADAAAALHRGKPALQKSEKIIFLTKAYNVQVMTDKVQAWLHLEGKIIKSRKISQKS